MKQVMYRRQEHNWINVTLNIFNGDAAKKLKSKLNEMKLVGNIKLIMKYM